jgi:hypothetical protein
MRPIPLTRLPDFDVRLVLVDRSALFSRPLFIHDGQHKKPGADGFKVHTF